MHIPFKLFHTDQTRPLFSGKDPEACILRLLELQDGSSEPVRIEFSTADQTIIMDSAPVSDALTFLVGLALNNEVQEDTDTEFVRTLIHACTTDIQHLKETCHRIQTNP